MSMLIGAFAVPKLFEKIPAIDLLVLSGTNLIFTATTGTILLTAAAIPGDGVYRGVELAAGLVMLLTVVFGAGSQLDGLMFVMGGLVDLPKFFGPIATLKSALDKLKQPKDANNSTVTPEETEPPPTST